MDQNKALAAGGGGVLGGALAQLVIALFWPKADAATAAALSTVLGTLTSYAGAYLIPHKSVE